MRATPKPPDIKFNGMRFAKAPRKKAGTPLEPQEGLDGWFKPSKSGVLLMEPDGAPFAFASANGGGFLVTAHLAGSKVRYMFGLAERTEKRLRITRYLHGCETARSILTQAGVAC